MLPFLIASLLALPGAAMADVPLLDDATQIVDPGPAMDLDWRHFAETGELRMPGERDEDDLEDRDLYPLGDADGDGRADVLSILRYEEEVVYQALSGRDGTVLWERGLEDDDDGFFWMFGDVNKDDVLDMTYIVVDEGENTGSGSTLTGFESRYPIYLEYEVFDGRDLTPLFDWTAEGELYMQYEGGLVVQGYSIWFSIPSLAPHPDLPGAIEYTYEWTEEEQNSEDVAGLVTVGHDDERRTVGLRGIDLDGEEAWHAVADEESTRFFITGLHDADGDEVRDFILTGVQYIPADDMTVAGTVIAPTDDEPESRVLAKTINGATGSTLLDWASEPSPEYMDGLVLPAGDPDGDGQQYTVLLIEYDFQETLLGGYDYDISFETMFLSAHGDILERYDSQDEILAAAVFADVDGDGDDELELLRAPLIDGPYGPNIDLDEAEYGIAQGDLSYVWSKTDLEDDMPVALFDAAYLPDFTGDGVPEIIWVDYDYDWLAARDGTDGAELWRFHLDEDDVQYLGAGPDLDDDGGTDLLWLEFKADEDAEDDWTRYTSGNLTALRGTDAAVFWEAPVYTHHPNETLGPHPYAGLYDAGDMDGDGAPDILVNIEGSGDGYAVVCEDGYCYLEEREMPDGMEEADVAFPLSGLHGDSLRFDDRSSEDYNANSLGPSAGPAQSDLEEAHDTPSPGAPLLLAGLALALWARRQRPGQVRND